MPLLLLLLLDVHNAQKGYHGTLASVGTCDHDEWNINHDEWNINQSLSARSQYWATKVGHEGQKLKQECVT